MARRRRTGRTSRWLPWSPALASLFRLATASGWTPPLQVRLTGGAHRQTLSARFQHDDGTVMTARLRLARDCADGARYVVGEELSIPLGILKPGAEA